MKKRILSAVLALCMLLVSVPFVALTAFGAPATVELPDEKEYKFVGSTAGGEGLPTFTDTRKTAFAYPEGWLLGMKDPTDVNSFNPLNKVSGQTAGALVVTGNQGVALNVGGGFTTAGSLSMNRFTITKTASGTVRFTSPYSGKATVTIDALNTSGASAFVVLVNGTPVWPTGASYADTSTWYALSSSAKITEKTAVATDITLNYGDTVEFVNAHTRDADYTAGMRGLDVTIKLTNITAKGTKSTLETNGMIFVDGTVPKPYSYKEAGAEDYYFADKAAYREYLESFGLVNYGGGWTNGVINKSTGAFEKIGRVMFYVDRCFSTTNDRDILFDNSALSAFDDMKWLITDKYFDETLEYVFNNPGLKKAPWVEGAGTQINIANAKVSQSRPTVGTHFAYTYTSNMSGMASVSIPAVVMDANPAVFNSIYLAVAVNGAVVWPANATANTTNNWYDALATETSNTDAAIAEAIGDLSFYVNEGDQIMFLVAVDYKNWGNSFKKVDGTATNTAIAVNPSVEITADETTVLQKEVIFKNQMGLPIARHTVEEGAALPALPGYVATKYLVNGTEAALPATVTENLVIQPLDDHSGFASRDMEYTIGSDNIATFPGPWKPVTGTFDEDTAILNQVYTDDTTWNYLEDLANYKASNAGFIGSDGMDWYKGRGLYNTTNRMLGIRPLGGYGVGLMFTAPSTGYVDLSFETLKVHRPNTGTEGTLACYFAIYLNGEIIWPAKSNPAADGAFYFESENTYENNVYGATEDMLAVAKDFEAFPTNLFVNAGDELSIIFSMGNGSCNAAFCDAIVSYSQVYAKPEVELSVSVGEEFGLNLQVNAPADATEVGISVRDNLVPLTAEGGVYKYSYPTVVAKKMVDTQTFTPYYKSADGQTIYGEEITASVADVLYAYVTSEETSEAVKNFAIAALNYGARAQTYFVYKPTNPANKNLTPEQKQLAAIGDSGKTLVNTAKDGATAEIIGAALLLDKQIQVKYFIDTNVSGLSLQVADNADFTDADTVALEARSNGNYKAFVEVALADLGDDMYVRVVDGDGNVVSNTVQYSVVAYADRMESNLYMADLVKAIYALANATAALTA